MCEIKIPTHTVVLTKHKYLKLNLYKIPQYYQSILDSKRKEERNQIKMMFVLFFFFQSIFWEVDDL